MIDLSNFIFIDLTHVLSSHIPHWGTDCGFKNKIKLDYDDCATEVKFRVNQLEMYSGIGTHMDAPSHCFPEGISIADIPLTQLIVPCIIIDVSDRADEKYSVTQNDIYTFENKHGTIPSKSFVIFHTGWEKFWNQPEKYRNDLSFPSISKEVAELLIERKVSGIGIDTLSPDRPEDNFVVHQIMLGSGRYIVENVANAKSLPPIGGYIFILPLKIQNGTEAPIRLIGMKGIEARDY